MQYVSRTHHYIGNRRQENNGLWRIGVPGQISRVPGYFRVFLLGAAWKKLSVAVVVSQAAHEACRSRIGRVGPVVGQKMPVLGVAFRVQISVRVRSDPAGDMHDLVGGVVLGGVVGVQTSGVSGIRLEARVLGNHDHCAHRHRGDKSQDCNEYPYTHGVAPLGIQHSRPSRMVMACRLTCSSPGTWVGWSLPHFTGLM